MKNKVITLICVIATLPIFGQTEPDKVGSVEINVSEAYKAQVKEAVRILDQPTLDDTTAKKIPVQFEVRSRAVATTFEPEPIKPITIAGSRLPRLPRNMVRLGIGNFTTPYAEVFLGNDRSKNFNWGVHLHHLSSQTGVRDLVFDRNTWYENEVNAYAKYIMRNSRLTLDLQSSFDRFSYYGLRESHIEGMGDLGPFDLVAQRYNTIAPTLVWESLKLEPTYIKKASLGYRYLWDAFNTEENHLNVTSDWVFPVKNETIETAININHVNTHFADSAIRFQFTQIQLAPQIKSQYENVFFTFGFNVNLNPRKRVIEDSVSETIYTSLFPTLLVDIPLVRNVLAVYGGIDGEMVNQNMQTLSGQNPFIAPVFGLAPRRTMRYFGGLKGILAKNVHYNASVYHHAHNDLALFYRDPTTEVFLQPQLGMSVEYDDVAVTGIRGELTYDNNKGLRIGGHANFRNFRMSGLPAAFHLPRAIVGVEGSYLWRQKLQGNINFNYVGSRAAFDATAFPNSSLNADLAGFLDVRLGATFHYNDQLSAFVNISNVLATDYELYLGYHVQRFLGMMGIVYRL